MAGAAEGVWLDIRSVHPFASACMACPIRAVEKPCELLDRNRVDRALSPRIQWSQVLLSECGSLAYRADSLIPIIPLSRPSNQAYE